MATNSSVESSFKFINYKVDNFHFEMENNWGLVSANVSTNPDNWNLKYKLLDPMFNEVEKQYLGGIAIEGEYVVVNKDTSEKVKLFRFDCSVVGTFEVKGKLEKKIENALVFNQIPALLLSYLRSTVSSFFANAGFGSFIIPLINIHELAKETFKDKKIKILEINSEDKSDKQKKDK